MTTFRVTTAPCTNASAIGEVYAAYDGVSWRHSIDSCDDSGNGRLFLDCQDEDTAELVATALDDDTAIVAYTELS